MCIILYNKLYNIHGCAMRRYVDAKPHKRAGIWYLMKRVPKEFAALDPRNVVKVSTDIAVADDPRAIRARVVVKQLAMELEAFWRGLRDGQAAEANLRYDAAQKRARAMGVVYQTAEELAAGPLDEILKRINILVDGRTLDAEVAVSAILGGEARPVICVSDLVKEFEQLQSATLSAYSPNQIKKWRNPKQLAINNFIEVVGDKPIKDLKREDTQAYRNWWQTRVQSQEVGIGTANKNIGCISRMFGAVDMAYQMDLKPVFRQLRLEGEVKAQRAAFDASFIQNVLLKDGALDALNDEARRILYVMVETGLRLSEIANLLEQNIKLDAPIPYVQIRGVGRKLKTEHSARDIPLVGVALLAMQAQPNGFPRYQDSAATLSATANKFLRENNMLPTDSHTIYGLRHSFEDRLTSIEAPEKVVAMLMGHKWIRPKYGAGPTLEQKSRWLLKSALEPPKHV